VKIIRVDTTAYTEAVEFMRNGQKISAIKRIRQDQRETIPLRDAKLAIERLMYELGIDTSNRYVAYVNDPDVPKIVCGPLIQKLVVDYGSGPIEVDLEGMQMRALVEMGAIGLDACRDILDLVSTLKAFSAGRRIGMLPEEEDGVASAS